MKKKVAIIGASGYTGAECAWVCLRHPGVEVVGLFGSVRRGGEGEAARMDEIFPRFASLTDLRVPAFEMAAFERLGAEVALLATPHEVSVELAPLLLERGVIVIDLSAAFRFRDAAVFERVYGFKHTSPDLLEKAAYGIPELNRDAIARASLIACAGCYPTSALIPLAPLARAGAIDASRPVIVDSVSGVSGAGRAATTTTHFCEVSLQAYKVLGHRHEPEMREQLGKDLIFTPHLGAFERGILSTIHVSLAPGWDGERVRREIEKAHAGAPFVRVLGDGQWPSLAACRGTNFCDVGVAVDESRRHAVVSSAIDNLLKGAAGQAAQCMNIRLGAPERAGLT